GGGGAPDKPAKRYQLSNYEQPIEFPQLKHREHVPHRTVSAPQFSQGGGAALGWGDVFLLGGVGVEGGGGGGGGGGEAGGGTTAATCSRSATVALRWPFTLTTGAGATEGSARGSRWGALASR